MESEDTEALKFELKCIDILQFSSIVLHTTPLDERATLYTETVPVWSVNEARQSPIYHALLYAILYLCLCFFLQLDTRRYRPAYS